MKKVIFIVAFVFYFAKVSYGQNEFHSSDEYNSYVFSQTDLPSVTTGFLLDREEEWSSMQIDSIEKRYKSLNYNIDDLISYFRILERTDVTKAFEKDSFLFPIMDHIYSNDGERELKTPLFILDYDFSRLSKENRKVIDNSYQQSFPQFSKDDFVTTNLFCASFFIDSLLLNGHNKFYWDQNTFLTNTNLRVNTVTLISHFDTIVMREGDLIDITDLMGDKDVLSQLSLKILYTNGETTSSSITFYIQKNKPTTSVNKFWGDDDFWDRDYSFGTNPELKYYIKYGCGAEKKMDKPFILVAGFGPYTDKWLINLAQGWPTNSIDMYAQMNIDGLCDDLLAGGYDIVLAQFFPPNADIRYNADRLETLINLINAEKFANGSYEENVIYGVSAGALCIRLTLERMEKKHLEQNRPHPHTKLFVSFDGENQGANIPLANQHAVWYLEEYQNGAAQLKIYALHYILNSTLSKQLLKYFYTETGNIWSPGQNHHLLRDLYLHEHYIANHDKNIHVEKYPSFTRNISISNGSSVPDITGDQSNNFPYPKIEKYVIFAQSNLARAWSASFNGSGAHTVFQYDYIHYGYEILNRFVTDDECLVLDNAPGGSVIGANPLLSTMELMESKISGAPDVYKPNTLFSFTPTLFTHDIRFYNPEDNNYRMNYNLKTNLLMFQNISDILSTNPPNYNWGYPHLAFPTNHWWARTPFDALFTWNVNTEHLNFDEATKDDLTNDTEAWRNIESATPEIYKGFILGEVDYHTAYIQNKKYGWYARDTYVYRAEVKVPKEIFAGTEVTQRTDFKVVEVLDNADITFQAGESITLKPGFQVKAGGVFHAIIQPYNCLGFKNMSILSNSENDENNSLSSIEKEMDKNDLESIRIFPNPSNGEITIQLPGKIQVKGVYSIYDLQGQLKTSNTLEGIPIQLSLKEGIYLIKVKHNNHEYTEKLFLH